MKKWWTLCCLFLTACLSVCGQVSDKEIADYHFNQGHFEEAILYYERLYKSEPSEGVYNNYLKCLLSVKKWYSLEIQCLILGSNVVSSKYTTSYLVEYRRFDTFDLIRNIVYMWGYM